MEKRKKILVMGLFLASLFFFSTILVSAMPFQVPTNWKAQKFKKSAGYDWVTMWSWINGKTEVATDVAVDASGNIIIVGHCSNLTTDQFILKCNSAGAALWNDIRDGGNQEWGKAVAINGSDIYVINKYLNQSSSRYECFLAKYNSTGNRQWNRSWFKNGENVSGCYVSDAVMDASINFYIIGEMEYTAAPYVYEYFILKLDSSGNEVWNITYGKKSIDRKICYGITVRGDILYVVGRIYENLSLNDGLLAKFNATSGKQIWNTSWGHPTDDTYANDVVTDTSGNIYVTGYYGHFMPDSRSLFVRKYGSMSTLLWAKTYSSSYGEGIAIDEEGFIYVAGALTTGEIFISYALLLKYDSDGTLLAAGNWDGLIDGQVTAYAVTVDTSGNTYLAGIVFTGGSDFAAFLIKNLALSPPGGIPGFEIVFLGLILIAIVFLRSIKQKKLKF